MNSLLKWNPIQELNDMQNRLASFIGASGGSGDGPSALATWAPVVDVTEDNNEILIKAELPEVKKEDLKVLIENGMLRISGERVLEKEEEGKKYHRLERSYGSFERTFSLPDYCKPEDLTAEYKDGMLTVHVPKREEAIPKAIEVQVK